MKQCHLTWLLMRECFFLEKPQETRKNNRQLLNLAYLRTGTKIPHRATLIGTWNLVVSVDFI